MKLTSSNTEDFGNATPHQKATAPKEKRKEKGGKKIALRIFFFFFVITRRMSARTSPLGLPKENDGDVPKRPIDPFRDRCHFRNN